MKWKVAVCRSLCISYMGVSLQKKIDLCALIYQKLTCTIMREDYCFNKIYQESEVSLVSTDHEVFTAWLALSNFRIKNFSSCWSNSRDTDFISEATDLADFLSLVRWKTRLTKGSSKVDSELLPKMYLKLQSKSANCKEDFDSILDALILHKLRCKFLNDTSAACQHEVIFAWIYSRFQDKVHSTTVES